MMIEIKNLSFKYSTNNLILNNLSLSVPKGSIFGFIGSNGSGKSTTIKCVLGLLEPIEGMVEIMNIVKPNKHYKVRSKVGYLIETPQFYGNLTAYENLLLLKKHLSFDNSRIKEVLELFGLWDVKDQLYSNFSTGMKQRLGIAKSFIANPELIILDEPLNGLDPSWIIEVRNILKKINNEYGTTILLSSHILSEMEKLVSHIGVLKNGSIVFQGKISDFMQKYDRSITIKYSCQDRNLDFSKIPGFNLISNENNIATFNINKDGILNNLLSFFLTNNLIIIDISTNSISLEEAVTKIYNL